MAIFGVVMQVMSVCKAMKDDGVMVNEWNHHKPVHQDTKDAHETCEEGYNDELWALIHRCMRVLVMRMVG